MKKFGIILLTALSCMFNNMHAGEVGDRVVVIVNGDYTLTLDEKFSDRATLLLKEQGNEYHLFTCDTIVAIEKINKSRCRVEIGEKDTYQFYRKNGQPFPVLRGLIDEMILVGPKQGFAATKFKVAKAMLFIHRPIAYEFTDNIGGLDVNYADKYQKLTGADTLKVSEKDTCSIAVTIDKPANMLYAGLYVNNKPVREYSVVNDKFFDKETVKEVIRPELLTKDFNTVQVKYLALDENGALKAELTDEFYIVKEKANKSLLLVYWVLIIFFTITMLLCVLILRIKYQKKLSNIDVEEQTVSNYSNADDIYLKHANPQDVINENDFEEYVESESSAVTSTNDCHVDDTDYYKEELEQCKEDLRIAHERLKEVEQLKAEAVMIVERLAQLTSDED